MNEIIRLIEGILMPACLVVLGMIFLMRRRS